VGLDDGSGQYQPGTVIVNPQPEQRREVTQEKLLKVVEKEVSDRIAQSLHLAVGKMLINLGKEMQPEWVRSPWDREISIGQRSPQPLPAETTILQVFERDDVQQKLLILGEPGAGKTTTLLELARDLVTRAKQATDQPIPVLLNLSSWKDPKLPILDWLAAEMKSKYGIRQDLGKSWLAQNQLLPLLDGLDEVAPMHQEACAGALNQWLTGDVEHRPMGVAVCCRRKEYEEVVRRHLFLDGAVFLQPLSEMQIQHYLDQFGLGTVWQSAQSSEPLQDLLSKPLFLSIFGLVAAEGNFDAADWQKKTTDAEQQEYLLDQYWISAMKRKLVDRQEQEQGILSRTYGKAKLPHQKAVRRALVFAAKALEQESQTELLIEKMQPSWLPHKSQRWLYRLIVGPIVGLIVGLFLGLTFGLINGSTIGLINGSTIGLILGLTLGLIVGLIVGLAIGLIGGLDEIKPVEALQISMSRFARRKLLRSLRLNLIFGLIGGLFLGLISGLIVGLFGGLSGGLIGGLIGGMATGLLVGLIFGLIGGLIDGLISGLKADIETRITPNQGMKTSRRNMLVLSAIAPFSAILLTLLLELTLKGIFTSGTILAVIAWSLFAVIWFSFKIGGGQALIQHIALRIILNWNGYAPFRYDRLLDYCTERLLLQRIGGRYRFMHKLMQEHFAKMELD
jgi:DNA polymerase III delta prime subunit